MTYASTLSSQQRYDRLTPAQHRIQYSRCDPTSDEQRGLIAFLNLELKALLMRFLNCCKGALLTHDQLVHIQHMTNGITL